MEDTSQKPRRVPIELDIDGLQESIDILGDDIESSIHEELSESIIHGFTMLQVVCELIDGNLSIKHYLLTDYGKKVQVDQTWEWRYLGTFDEDHSLAVIMDQFGSKYSEILNEFGLDISDVMFSIEPYPDEGY